jgi:hypothetical protein
MQANFFGQAHEVKIYEFLVLDASPGVKGVVFLERRRELRFQPADAVFVKCREIVFFTQP